MYLKGKRILFFSVRLFDIEKEIASELRKAGAIVDYYDERPANSFLVKALIRLNRNLISSYIDRYHKKIIKDTCMKKYDYVFFIKGEAISEKNLKKLLLCHPEAKSIIYHWDSIANNNNAKKLLHLFDKKFSFDNEDCKNFNLSFLPLFYYSSYQQISNINTSTDYDLLFVGTAHSDRYKIVMNIKRQIESLGGLCYTFFFFQGKIMFYKYKLSHKEIRSLPISKVNFKPLSKKEILDLYSKSRIVLDIQHPKQTGLTLRTMEALGAKRKLITTNHNIKSYDFYNENNILVIDRMNPMIPEGFLNSPYEEIELSIYSKYSITSWVKNIFKDDG